MKVAFVGYGQFGRQLHQYLKESHVIEEYVIFDDIIEHGRQVFPFNHYQNDAFQDHHFYVTVGYHHLSLRSSIISKLIQAGRKLPSFVHPSVLLSPTTKINSACIVLPGCILDQEVELAEGAILQQGVKLSHQTRIGESSYLSPGVIACGQVSIGKHCFIGAGACISNQVEIGDNSVIGIGSVVTSALPNATHAIGNPLRILAHALKLK